MTAKTRGRRRNGAADEQPSATPTGDGQGRDATFDDVIERFSIEVAREGISDELGASAAVLRGSIALREMQADAARRTQAMHEKAVEQLQSARSVAELASVGMMLTQGNAEAVVRYWTDYAGIATRTALESWNEAIGALARTQQIVQAAGRQWLDAAAAVRPDVVEAQVEHVTTPVTSSPLVWPTQEAVREAISAGTRSWNEWLGSAMPAAAQFMEAAAAAATPPTRH